jgi:hypothetical protein
LTDTASFQVLLGGRWLEWGPEVAEALTSGAAYRFRFEHEGYAPRTYSLSIQPYQTLLRLEAQLVPDPGILRLHSNAGGLKVALNGSPYYFSGGKDRAYRPLEPLEEGSRELRLSPGRYRLTVERDAGLTRSLDVDVQAGRTVTVRIELDRGRRSLEVTALE